MMDFKWSATITGELPTKVVFSVELFHTRLAEEIMEHVPIFSVYPNEKFGVTLGVEGETAEEACLHGVEIVHQALGRMSMGWIPLRCAEISQNSRLANAIEKIEYIVELPESESNALIIPFPVIPRD